MEKDHSKEDVIKKEKDNSMDNDIKIENDDSKDHSIDNDLKIENDDSKDNVNKIKNKEEVNKMKKDDSNYKHLTRMKYGGSYCAAVGCHNNVVQHSPKGKCIILYISLHFKNCCSI